MFFVCGRESEYPDKTQATTKNMQTLNRKIPEPGIEPTFLLWPAFMLLIDDVAALLVASKYIFLLF